MAELELFERHEHLEHRISQIQWTPLAIAMVDEGGPGADLRQIGDDPALYAKTFERHDGDQEKALGCSSH